MLAIRSGYAGFWGNRLSVGLNGERRDEASELRRFATWGCSAMGGLLALALGLEGLGWQERQVGQQKSVEARGAGKGDPLCSRSTRRSNRLSPQQQMHRASLNALTSMGAIQQLWVQLDASREVLRAAIRRDTVLESQHSFEDPPDSKLRYAKLLTVDWRHFGTACCDEMLQAASRNSLGPGTDVTLDSSLRIGSHL